jgi:group I intron endonuclease
MLYRTAPICYFIIYKTTNLINGKIYVGQRKTDDLNDGYIGDGILSQIYAKYHYLFHRAVRKYGYENFKREIIEYCFYEEQLSSREIYWIKKLNAHWTCGGYNMTWGGDGGDYFTDHPRKEEIRKRMSDSHRGSIKPEETILNFKETYYNRPLEICPYCGYESRNAGILKQLHFDNCEQNPNRVITEDDLLKKQMHRDKMSTFIKNRPIQTCPWCGFQDNGVIINYLHFDNCKMNPNYIPKEYICPYCDKHGSGSVMFQYHFDNCKLNPNYITKTKPIQICPHCGKQGRGSAMRQWHFDNCRYKYNISNDVILNKCVADALF